MMAGEEKDDKMSNKHEDSDASAQQNVVDMMDSAQQ